MSLTDCRVSDTDFENKNIQSLSDDTVLNRAEELKALFDSPAQVVMADKHNDLIDALEDSTAASSIGAPELNTSSGSTVAAQLLYLQEQIAAAVLGQITDGSITDAKLSGETGQIKAKVTALETSDAAKAPKASPEFTGTPAAPTAAAGTNTTQIATTAYVRGELGFATTHVENAAIHVTGEQKTAWNSHKDSTANPHGVTAEQAGAAASDHTHTAADVGALASAPIEAWTGQIYSVGATAEFDYNFRDYRYISVVCHIATNPVTFSHFLLNRTWIPSTSIMLSAGNATNMFYITCSFTQSGNTSTLTINTVSSPAMTVRGIYLIK